MTVGPAPHEHTSRATRWWSSGAAWLLPATAAACVVRAGLLLPTLVTPVPRDVPPTLVEAAPPANFFVPDPVSVQAIVPEAGPPEPAGADPPLNPKALLEVAGELKRRRVEVERRERELDERAAGLRRVDEELAAKVDQLENLKRDLEGMLGRLAADEAERVDRLVKVYEAMKPGKAAAIFDATDLKLLVPLVKRMREVKIAAIIEGMEPGKARALTHELARAKEVPTLAAMPLPSLATARGESRAGTGGRGREGTSR